VVYAALCRAELAKQREQFRFKDIVDLATGEVKQKPHHTARDSFIPG
jgi:hypothetical protein